MNGVGGVGEACCDAIAHVRDMNHLRLGHKNLTKFVVNPSVHLLGRLGFPKFCESGAIGMFSADPVGLVTTEAGTVVGRTDNGAQLGYVGVSERVVSLAHRMLAAANKARDAARGHEAVCVSHQLPVYTLRRFLEGQRLWHDPRRRQCSLASLTSLIYDDDALVDIIYSEPAGHSDPLATGA